MRMLLSIVAVGVSFASGHVVAQDESDASPEFPSSGRVVVTSPTATAQIADEEPRPVETASVLTYSRTNADWLWVDSLWGWIDKSEVVLLSDADEHYTKLIDAAKENKRPAGVALHQRGIVKLALGKNKAALKDFDAAIEDGYVAANVYINRGQALGLLDKHEEAIKSFTEAIAREPENGLAYDARAIELADQDFLEVALGDADRAVELAPESARVWYDRGLLRQRDGQFKPAIADYNKSLELSPRYVEAVANRGFCLKRINRFEDAEADYRKAVEINPKLAVAHNDLAWLLATCKDESIRDSADAIESGETAVELSGGNDGRFLDTLAAAYASAEKWESAVKTAREAVEKLDGADQYEADQRLTGYLNKQPYVEE